jgi:RNA polymerase sigma-70 factor (ECF subfamily)
MDCFRRRKNTSSFNEVDEISVEKDPLYEVIQSEQMSALSKLIQSLPQEDRELLRLRFLADMSFPEIARFLHRKEEAIKKSIYRLLARLKSQVEVSNE